MRRSIYSLLAWKNVTFLSRIKRNREINIQFLRSGKRCKFQLSDSRCPRCPDKIVQIRVVYYFYSRKRRIFSSCFKLFPSFFFIYLFIYLLVPFRRNRRGIAAKCSQIEKILRGRKQFPRRHFEDDLYTYSGVVSVIAYTFYLSAHVPRFLRFLGGNIGWKCAGNISPRKSEKLFQQTWKTSVNNFHVSIHAERIREKSISLIYIYTSSTFFALRSSPTLFKLSSYTLIKYVRFFKFQVFKHFIPFSQICIYILISWKLVFFFFF